MKSDMFDESDNEFVRAGFEIFNNFQYGTQLATLSVKSSAQSKKLGKEKGDYLIINCPNIHFLGEDCINYVENILKDNLSKFVGDAAEIMIVGLGSPAQVADSLGPKVIDKIFVTRNLNLKGVSVCAICPDIYATTGIMTCDLIEGVISKVAPDLVVIIDSLGTYSEKRIASSFQITNSSIVPGGALHAGNKEISKKSLGVNCLIIGVPLMLINDNALSPTTEVLCPKNIDEYVCRCALIISNAINRVLHKNYKKLHKLLM